MDFLYPICITSNHFIQSNNIFMIIIIDFQQRIHFSFKCLLRFNLICNLNVYLITRFLSNKIYFVIIVFTDIWSIADFPLLLIPVITLMTGLSTKGLILDMYKGRSFILIFLTIANIHFLGL